MTAVARSALAAVGPGSLVRPGSPFPLTVPVHVELTFVTPTRQDKPPGSPWACTVKPNGDKADPSVPDLDGLIRATLLALAGIVLADVSQVGLSGRPEAPRAVPRRLDRDPRGLTADASRRHHEHPPPDEEIMEHPLSPEALAFRAALIEVDFEDTLEAMSFPDDLLPVAIADHRHHGQAVFDEAFVALDRIGARFGRRPAVEMADDEHSTYQDNAMFLYAAALIEARHAVDKAQAGSPDAATGVGDAFRVAMIEVEIEDALGRLDPGRERSGGEDDAEQRERAVARHRWLGPGMYVRLTELVTEAGVRFEPRLADDDSEAAVRLVMELAADLCARCVVGLWKS